MRKYRKLKLVFSILILTNIILLFTFPSNENSFGPQHGLENNSRIEPYKAPLGSSSTPNSRPLLVTHHSMVSNSFLSPVLPKNVSYTLVNGWTSKNTTINYEDISQKKDRVTNGDLSTSITGWTYKEVDKNGVFIGGYSSSQGNPAGCASVDCAGGKEYIKGDQAYIEQNVSIPEQLASKELTLSFDYLYTHLTRYPNISFYMAIINNGIEKNKTVHFDDAIQSITVYKNLKYIYDPVLFGQVLPGKITVRIGVYINSNSTRGSSATYYLYLDNVKLELWTKPNQKFLVKAHDVEFDTYYPYYNTTYGKGYSFINVDRVRTLTNDVKFTIYNNMTGILDFEVNNITITSHLAKYFNSTLGGVAGSTYINGDSVAWNTAISINMPYNYLNNWIEIEKPNDWNITSILDGFDVPQEENCLGTGRGSTKIIIPDGTASYGLWKLEAISQNYIDSAHIALWNGEAFINSSTVSHQSLFQINITLNESVSFSNTYMNCTIFYPNGSIFWQEFQEVTNLNVKLGNFTVGTNMSVGDYEIEIEWTNNLSYIGRDKVGHKTIEFEVQHKTSLTAVKSYVETMAGSPLLVKVNYTDTDFNTYIDFAEVKYNTSAYGLKGSMAYIGSGIYVIDLDTTGFALGAYSLSFNASKSCYERKSIKDLIQLVIIAEPLALEVPRTPINVYNNSYAVFQINVTGATSGSLIASSCNISTNWNKAYTIDNYTHGGCTGIYTLNLSTQGVMTSGETETFTVTVYANKTNYGTTSDIVTLTVHPIKTVGSVNATMIEVHLSEIFYVKANYSVESSGQLISGSNCTVIWDSTWNISVIANQFVICFNTSGLTLNVYTAVIQLNHSGYETAFKIIYVIMKPSPSVLTILNQAPIKFIKGDLINISSQFTSSGKAITDCSIDLIGDFSDTFTKTGSVFYCLIDSTDLTTKNYFVQIYATALNYESQFEEMVFELLPLELEIETDDTSITFKEGKENKVSVKIRDTSHDISRTDLKVTYEINDVSEEMEKMGDGSYELDLNKLSLSPRTEPYELVITVENPYGDDVSITISIVVPFQEVNVPLIVILAAISIAGVISAFLVKRRYFDLSKFQRQVRKAKAQILKGQFEKIPVLTRDDVIAQNIEKIMPSIKEKWEEVKR